MTQKIFSKKSEKNKKRKKDGAMINDDRFKHMHVDPKFMPIHSKTRISDPRMHKLFKKEFEMVQSTSRNKDALKKQLLEEMYEFRNEGERMRVDDMMDAMGADESSDEDDILLKRVKHTAENGKNLELTELEEEQMEQTEKEDILENESELDEEEQDLVNQLEVVPTIATGEETNRLSVMNFDWRIIKTPDIFTIVNSFCPPTGRIKKVTTYLSRFGEEKLREEELYGPGAVFLTEEEYKLKMEEKKNYLIEKQKKKEDRLVIREDRKKKAQRRLKELENFVAETESDYLNLEKVREYEMQKLKYYFSVVECDSAATAIKIYQDLDGFEVESTGTVLDLRFIPDDVAFDRPTLDSPLTKPPKSYQNKKNMTNITLRSSSTRLTWDEDEPTRATALKRKDFTDQDYHTLNQFLASDSDSESDSENEEKRKEKRKLYKKLAKSSQKLEKKVELNPDSETEEASEASGKGFTISFDSNLEEQAKNLQRSQLEKAKLAKETPWETKERLRKERKKKEKLERKKQFKRSEAEALEKMAQDPNDEVQQKLKELVDDPQDPNTNMKGFNIQRDTYREMSRRKQNTKIKESDDFSVNLTDPRFRDRLLSDPQFTIDPTDKKFKRDSNFEKIVQAKEDHKKRKRESSKKEKSKRQKVE